MEFNFNIGITKLTVLQEEFVKQESKEKGQISSEISLIIQGDVPERRKPGTEAARQRLCLCLPKSLCTGATATTEHQ